MPLDAGPLAQQAAEFIDELIERYGEDAELEGCLMIASVRLNDDERGGATQWNMGDLPSPHALGLAYTCATALTEGEEFE